MRLATFLPPGSTYPRAGEVHDDEVISFVVKRETVLERLRTSDYDPAIGDPFALADVTLLAPVPRPRAIFGIGMNYAAHAAEQGVEVPEQPIVFMKLPSSSAPPNGPVTCPAVVKRLDYEGELVVVMGADAKIAGYAVANDVSARDLQRREPQWTRAKGADGFCPWGPWITTADKVPDPKNLRITTHVNGELRQDSSTADLIFGPQELVDFISRDLHARARRPHPHRHAERRRHVDGPAPVPASPAMSCASRSRRSGRSSMPSPELLARLGELSDLRHAGHVLVWDQQVMMPPRGGRGRGRAMGTLRTLAHERLVDPELGALLDADADADDRLVRAVRRDRDVACRVPGELAAEMGRAGSEGFEAWLRAREANDFAVFEPALRRNMELARRYADCFAENEHPYDALLDRYEPGRTAADVAALFVRLRGGLVPLLAEIAAQPAPPPLRGGFPTAAQREVGLEIVHAMGFDETAWRLDDAVHPFAASPSTHDIRVTSRFDDHSLTGLFALMHEVGHGLYEHGTDPALDRTTLDTGVSLGVHESQSRLWENLVGRSEPFWRHWLPRLAEAMPQTLDGVDLDTFLRAINVVRPTLIRVEADELTYTLHVILRFELELDLIEGTLDVADLPEAWAAKMRELLGVEVPDDLRGVLQDVHWSEGIIGYFPTYAIGNVLAAQLWRVLRADLPGLDDSLRAGEYGDLRAWLVEKIHRHGRRLTPAELVEQAVGGPLDPGPMLEHLDAKYRALYGLVA